MKDSIIQAFFALIRAGLWGTEVQLSDYGDIDYSSVMSLAEEQSVVGLVTAGLDCRRFPYNSSPIHSSNH